MIYVTPGLRLSCTTESAATSRRRSSHLTGENSPTLLQNCRIREVYQEHQPSSTKKYLPIALALGVKVL